MVSAGQKTLHLKGLGVPMQTASSASCTTQSSVALHGSIRDLAFIETEVMAESRKVSAEGLWLPEKLQERDLLVLVAGVVVMPVRGGKTTCQSAS